MADQERERPARSFFASRDRSGVTIFSRIDRRSSSWNKVRLCYLTEIMGYRLAIRHSAMPPTQHKQRSFEIDMATLRHAWVTAQIDSGDPRPVLIEYLEESILEIRALKDSNRQRRLFEIDMATVRHAWVTAQIDSGDPRPVLIEYLEESILEIRTLTDAGYEPGEDSTAGV
jgi:hypothetical protein